MKNKILKILHTKIFNLLIKNKNHKNTECAGFKKRFFLIRDLLRLKIYLYILENAEKGKNSLSTNFFKNCYKYLDLSKGQLFQDIFALTLCHSQNGGFFVEFGATDGIKLSNTFLLENYFSWEGILAEPSKIWQKSLIKNRKCKIDYGCVFSYTGKEIQFTQHNDAELSGISAYLGKEASNQSSYKTLSISLLDLLIKHNAPKAIDFLSMDTEGSEYEILKVFDFSRFTFKYISVEHNYNDELRQHIYQILVSNGYQRVMENISAHDDWYINSSSIIY